MKTNQIGLDLGGNQEPNGDFLQFERIITDRGSKYSVTGGKVSGKEDIKTLLKRLTRDKKYAKATHHSWAARVSKDGQIWEVKNDDGETGAGGVILRILQKQNWVNTVVVVTRWYGGKKLGPDRFKHVQDATVYWCNHH